LSSGWPGRRPAENDRARLRGTADQVGVGEAEQVDQEGLGDGPAIRLVDVQG
jgi:hypothetical protein